MFRYSLAVVGLNNLLTSTAHAQDALESSDSSGSLVEAVRVVFSGGVTGVAIILLLAVVSVIALALVVEHWLTIRRSVLMPDGLASAVRG